MSDTLLETICINGTRPPYKRPAWVIGQVGSEELQNRRAQTATSRERQNHSSYDKRRPKSTPCRLNVSFNDSQRPRCSRWRQVYSARNRGSLDDPYNDDSMMITLAPGYVLSRNKEKINVTITDEFFKEGSTKPKTRKKSQPLDEKDIVIQQLHQQTDDLTLFLEEERLNHKFNLRKAEEDHQLHIEQITEEHREHIKSVEDDHDEEIEKLKNSFNQQLHEERRTAEVEKSGLQGEMECLQGAFEAYKETVAVEMDFKWQRRVKELRDEHERHTEDELSKQRREMLHDKNKEIDGLNKEFQRQIQVLVEDHKKEVDNLMEKFAECVQDSEQLKSALLEMQTLKQKKQELEEKLKTNKEILRKTQMELEDKKIKLAAFEEHFEAKVEEVDNRYSMRMQGLMSDNTDLRRHYIKKCEQFFKLKTDQDAEQDSAIRTAKDTLQAVILARTRCDVSLTALRNENPDLRKQEPNTREKRPLSAPSTREEISTAVRLTAPVSDNKTPTNQPKMSKYKSEVNKPRPHTSHHATMYSPRTLNTSARSNARENLVPTPVNISNQGIQNLRTQREFLS
ncbi:flagellum-associated coiled-coil domain-containing protein 1-like [Porites lutea]|uniref:flagellum-associated coiled-coil domain-containing protein 1-like n=1 Tax=Porites lutea TaxID=51062 RepID=UPI003CC6D7D8